MKSLQYFRHSKPPQKNHIMILVGYEYFFKAVSTTTRAPLANLSSWMTVGRRYFVNFSKGRRNLGWEEIFPPTHTHTMHTTLLWALRCCFCSLPCFLLHRELHRLPQLVRHTIRGLTTRRECNIYNKQTRLCPILYIQSTCWAFISTSWTLE